MTATFLGVSLKMYLDHTATLRWVSSVAAIAREQAAVDEVLSHDLIERIQVSCALRLEEALHQRLILFL